MIADGEALKIYDPTLTQHILLSTVTPEIVSYFTVMVSVMRKLRSTSSSSSKSSSLHLVRNGHDISCTEECGGAPLLSIRFLSTDKHCTSPQYEPFAAQAFLYGNSTKRSVVHE